MWQSLTSARRAHPPSAGHRGAHTHTHTPEAVLRDLEMFYGGVGSVMADTSAVANRARRDVIVSSCEVRHLPRQPA